jgi:hypothetical protein
VQRTNSFNEQVLSRASSTEKSGSQTDQVVGGAADGSAVVVVSRHGEDISMNRSDSGWQRLRSGASGAALRVAVEFRQGGANGESTAPVQVGEGVRPSLFQRRPSMFAASADDVSSIEVFHALAYAHDLPSHLLFIFSTRTLVLV